MFEQILKRRPKGATHWQAGYYYNSDECGIWSIWENGKWHGDFKFPDGVMTKLPEEKEPVMSEFEGKSGKWAWEIQKEQKANLVELRSSIENLVQKYKHDAHASSLFGDQDKARVYNCFANQLKNLLKGGA
ncbi:hypothetical protein [Acinetobacter baumannii]|uniref:hypothetical protein n=1 Tax=Acinetobacter baumannii TaxID=470 RepID=UPI001660F74C|nr:hypothetical protein [Acinetobacter baumannii]MBD0540069.1 hypothetical protein [Acinetobacter baumannii]MBD0589169.1 hypothetical protein [Acinetobacter baumannii]MBD0622085.1 hypothetical protein [Acinetobacter baumannii]MBD0648672.1 hypothetical protein [Acinetobacter baumannii]